MNRVIRQVRKHCPSLFIHSLNKLLLTTNFVLVMSQRPQGESGNKHGSCPPRVHSLEEASGASRKTSGSIFCLLLFYNSVLQMNKYSCASIISQERLRAHPVVQPLWGQAALEDQGWLRSLYNIMIIKIIANIYSVLIVCWARGWTIFLEAPLWTVLFVLWIVTFLAPRTGPAHRNCLRKIC